VDFDWSNPDYTLVFQARIERLKRLRDNPSLLPGVRAWYRDHPADFINDWGMTYDPRNIEVGRPAMVPFLLFKRQREWIDWVVERWQARRPGVCPKSRDMGLSWLAVALADTLCLFHDDMAIGFGSRKLELVDKLGDPKTLFWKARKFLEMLPAEFTGGWNARAHSIEGLIRFPTTGSTIAGEGGDEIGRGARTGLYFLDEEAFLARPETTEAALSQTTNCRIGISTPNGLANPFATKVLKWPAESVFRFHWRDDPRKDEAWYAKQQAELDPVTLAQEVDMDFSASVTGVVIPSAWVQAAIGLHERLGIEPTGQRRGALDVADEGVDMNAFASMTGILIDHLEEWSGRGSDIFATTQRAFFIADGLGLDGFDYDADGLGAGVRGDARVINEQRAQRGMVEGRALRALTVTPHRGSGAVENPDAQDVPGRANKDFFKNLKAQRWWGLRRRFEQSWRATQGMEHDASMIISLARDLPLLDKLTGELSQATYSLNAEGKIVIDKAPDGVRSPNCADAVVIVAGRTRRRMVIAPDAVRRA